MGGINGKKKCLFRENQTIISYIHKNVIELLLDAFINMSEDEKQTAIEKSRRMNSRTEMERLVNNLEEL